MSSGKLLLFIAAVGSAAYWWHGHREAAQARALLSPNGFLPVAMPDGAADNTVIILAPLNCPSDAAQRAEALAAELGSRGIRAVRSSSYQVNIVEPTDEDRDAMERAVSVLNGQIPAVFVNGMAKSNPTAEEVAAEYSRTR